MIVILCPNTVPDQLNRYAANVSTLTLFKLAPTWAAATTILGIPEKPFTVPPIINPLILRTGEHYSDWNHYTHSLLLGENVIG